MTEAHGANWPAVMVAIVLGPVLGVGLIVALGYAFGAVVEFLTGVAHWFRRV